MKDIFELNEKRAELARLEAEIKKAESSSELKRQMEFLDKLDQLITEYGYDKAAVIKLLGGNNKSGRGNRSERVEKVYRNPKYPQNTVTTRGGNTKVLNQWRDELRAEGKTDTEIKQILDSWIIERR